MMHVLTIQTPDGGVLRFTEPSFRAACVRLDRLASGIHNWRAVSISPRSLSCQRDLPTPPE